MDSFIYGIKNWRDFSGRTSRRDFWVFIGIYIFILIILDLVFVRDDSSNITISDAFYLLMLLPQLSISVRRFHDVNVSGWFILLPVVNLIFLLRKGDVGKNNYGPAA